MVNLTAEAIVLLGTTLGLDAAGSLAAGRRCRRWRSGCDASERFAKDPSAAAAYASDIEAWLQLTGYADDAAARPGRSDTGPPTR